MASSSSGTPGPGGYWLRPPSMAAFAASSISRGPSVSGKPWPRFTAPCSVASAVISAKMVVPKGAREGLPGGRAMARGYAAWSAVRRSLRPVVVERRGSVIAGRGLFTAEPLAQGSRVDADPDLLNHSCDPTLAWTTGGELVAFRDVVAGEELTVDYATTSADPQMLVRCHCETYRCRQMVTGDDWRIPQLRGRYAGHFAPAVQVLVDAQP